MFGSKTTLDMTSGSALKLICMFSAPFIASNIFQQLYTIVDTMVVGKALGLNALAALSSIDTMNWIVLGIIQGMTQGFGILIAQKFGTKEMQELNRIIKNAFVLSFLLAMILLAGIQLLVNPFLIILRVPLEITSMATLYLRIIIGGVPIVVAYNMESVVLRSLGDSESPFVAITMATIINVVLDILLVVVLGFGIAGAAIATLIAQLVSAIYCAYRIRKIDFVKMSLKGIRLDRDWTVPMLKLGSPLAFQNMIISIGGVVLQAVIDGYGVVVIAGMTAANKLYGILDSVGLAIEYAMVTYVGQNYGAKKVDRIRKGVTIANVLSFISCAIFAIISINVGKSFLSLFISGSPDVVEETMKYAYRFLVDMSVSMPLLYMIHVFRAQLQGIGHTVITMTSGLVELVIRIAAALTVPAIFGPMSLYRVYVLAWIGSDILLIIAYFYYSRRLAQC